MNKRILLPIAAAMALASHAGVTMRSKSNLYENRTVIPDPEQMIQGTGTFTFQPEEKINVPQWKGDSIAMVLEVMQRNLKAASGAKFERSNDGRIAMRINPAYGPEAYALDVTRDSIVMQASAPKGFLYAMQSLLQLMPVESSPKDPASIQTVSIVDEPRFEWRGFMLDEGRHFFGKETVKRIIDIMSLYKMNRFHWHLTEDQGWRIAMPEYPLLTTVGATRESNRLGLGNNRERDDEHYGPFYYTADDIREVVDYARKRHIDIVPEVDLPGHAQAVVAAYPELACDPQNPHSVWRDAGVSRDVLNVANEKVVKFTNDVIDTLLELFPFGYIHLGGDECPTDKWKENEACKQLLKQLGSDNYADLQTNYYRRVNDHIKQKGAERRLIFWNEVLEGNTDAIGNDGMTIMSWVDWENAAKEAAARGYDVVMSPYIPFYINRRQTKQPYEPNVAGAGTETLEAVYAYEPLENVTENADKYIGVQANFWTEWVDNESLLHYLMLPRLAAVAERGWSPREIRGLDYFTTRLDNWHTDHYLSRGYNFNRENLKAK